MANPKQTNLARLIHDHCYMAQKSRKQFAVELGITESVLTGIMAGRTPDGVTLIKLLNWLVKEVVS